MTRILLAYIQLVILSHGLLLANSASTDAAEEKITKVQAGALFHAKLLPILKKRCMGCHGDDPKEIAGSLDLRTQARMLKGRDSEKPAIIAGQPDKSPLYIAITWQDQTLQMPPKERNRFS